MNDEALILEGLFFKVWVIKSLLQTMRLDPKKVTEKVYVKTWHLGCEYPVHNHMSRLDPKALKATSERSGRGSPVPPPDQRKGSAFGTPPRPPPARLPGRAPGLGATPPCLPACCLGAALLSACRSPCRVRVCLVACVQAPDARGLPRLTAGARAAGGWPG